MWRVKCDFAALKGRFKKKNPHDLSGSKSQMHQRGENSQPTLTHGWDEAKPAREPGVPSSSLCSLNYRNYTGSAWLQLWDSLHYMQSQKNERRKKEEESSAGHHVYWQLVNKLKKRDAGALSPPLPLSSVADNWCSFFLGSDGIFRCWNQ